MFKFSLGSPVGVKLNIEIDTKFLYVLTGLIAIILIGIFAILKGNIPELQKYEAMKFANSMIQYNGD